MYWLNQRASLSFCPSRSTTLIITTLSCRYSLERNRTSGSLNNAITVRLSDVHKVTDTNLCASDAVYRWIHITDLPVSLFYRRYLMRRATVVGQNVPRDLFIWSRYDAQESNAAQSKAVHICWGKLNLPEKYPTHCPIYCVSQNSGMLYIFRLNCKYTKTWFRNCFILRVL